MTFWRAIGLFLAAIPATLAGFVLCLFRPFHRRNNRDCARMYAQTGLRVLNARVKVEGWHNLPRHEPCVLAANHQSNLDLYFYGQVIPENAVVVGKQSLAWVPFFGQIFWLGGNVFIRRQHRQKAMSAMAAASRAIVEKRQSLWIMPEGTRSQGRGLLPFRKGAFHTAVATGAPITLVCFSDYLKALRQADGGPCTVTVRVLPPIRTEHLGIGDVPQLMARCRALMIEALTEINGESPVPGEGQGEEAA